MEPNSSNQLLRINDVSNVTSLAKSTINLWVAQGKFPEPKALSITIKVWRLKDVIAWIDQQYGDEPNHASHDSTRKLKIVNS